MLWRAARSGDEQADEGFERRVGGCEQRCAGYSYFAVGAAHPSPLVDGGCVCLELKPLDWQRDALGMPQLKKEWLERLPAPKAGQASSKRRR